MSLSERDGLISTTEIHKPVSVKTLKEFEGGGSVIGYYVHGHMPYRSFLEALKLMADSPDIISGSCRHEYWRNIPNGADTKSVGMSTFVAQEKGRGAYPVTVIYV